jgi:hypothetical protein
MQVVSLRAQQGPNFPAIIGAVQGALVCAFPRHGGIAHRSAYKSGTSLFNPPLLLHEAPLGLNSWDFLWPRFVRESR